MMITKKRSCAFLLCAVAAGASSGCAGGPPTGIQQSPASAESSPNNAPAAAATPEAAASTSLEAAALAELSALARRVPVELPVLDEFRTEALGDAGLQETEIMVRSGSKVPTKRKSPWQLEVKYAQVSGSEGRTAFVRTYNGKLVGPTLRARPGDTLVVDLVNSLPEDSSDPAGAHAHMAEHATLPGEQDMNIPHGFNVTNLHFHGLHVRPDYPSRCRGKRRDKTCSAVADNVLVEVLPGKRQRYEIEIPKDHPPGTHWYHAHKHGAVAMQLASGMAGALIIQGGLDDLPELKRAKEQVMVFQQLTLTPCGRRETVPDGQQSLEDCKMTSGTTTTAYESCGAYFQRLVDAGKLPFFPKNTSCVENFTFSFGPDQWQGTLVPKFGARTSINGVFTPRITIKQGELQRWRMIHAGIRETLRLELVPQNATAPSRALRTFATIESADPERRAVLAERMDAGDRPVPFRVVAHDGIATGRMDTVDNIELEPAYRVDALVRIDAPATGKYLLIDRPLPARDSLLAVEEAGLILAEVIVEPSTDSPMPLPSDAALAPLAPYKHVDDREVKGCRYNTFNITAPPPPQHFLVNGQSYNPSAPARKVPLGKAEEWVVDSGRVNHPFHIHVNAFELVEKYGPFPKGTWKDTLLVQGPGLPPNGQPSKPVKIRTRYEDFTGLYVLHCHILDHEDQGMMQTVETVPRGEPTDACSTLSASGPEMCASPPPADGNCPKPSK